MFVPAPINENFVPCSNRRVLRRHASLIIDGTGGKGGGAIPRVVPQYTPCPPGSYCGGPCTPPRLGMACSRWGTCLTVSDARASCV
jgi:hypothetical protein